MSTVKYAWPHHSLAAVVMAVATVVSGMTVVPSAWMAPASAAPAAPFIGAWEGIDSADGSQLTLLVGAGGGETFRIALLDTNGEICGGTPEQPIGFVATAVAVLQTETFLVGDIRVRCLTSPPVVFGPIPFFSLEYQPATDTLEDGFGMIYSRMGAP